MRDTTVVGDIAELMVQASLTKHRHDVAKPISNSKRYDLLWFVNGEWTRVQVKNGRYREGAVRFNSCNLGRNGRKDYRGEVDYFGVFCDELGEVYMVPVDEVGITEVSLRVDPPKNNQTRNVRMAEPYRTWWRAN